MHAMSILYETRLLSSRDDKIGFILSLRYYIFWFSFTYCSSLIRPKQFSISHVNLTTSLTNFLPVNKQLSLRLVYLYLFTTTSLPVKTYDGYTHVMKLNKSFAYCQFNLLKASHHTLTQHILLLYPSDFIP